MLNMIIDTKDIEITLCKSDQTKHLGAHVGVQIKHREKNITVQSISHKSQYKNKLVAIELLKEELARLL
jgi:protein subunit release factor A